MGYLAAFVNLPDFHLCFGNGQQRGHFCPFRGREILLVFELLLELEDLLASERCPSLLFLLLLLLLLHVAQKIAVVTVRHRSATV